MIDWLNIASLTAFIGGTLVGLSAALFILVNGKIAGVSGILGRVLERPTAQNAWRIAFIIGQISAPLVYGLFGTLPEVEQDAELPLLLLAGLLVGLGTSVGGGCTSGHGVCGLSRLSLRSLIATLSFMGSGMLTVWLIKHAFV